MDDPVPTAPGTDTTTVCNRVRSPTVREGQLPKQPLLTRGLLTLATGRVHDVAQQIVGRNFSYAAAGGQVGGTARREALPLIQFLAAIKRIFRDALTESDVTLNIRSTYTNLSTATSHNYTKEIAMTFSFNDRVKLPDDVLISGLQAESVLLNLDNERYYGLNDVGTRMLTLLTSSDSIEAAYNTLLDEYEIEADVLRGDLISTIEELKKNGLIEIVSGPAA
jgi:hypothetical protein